MRRVDLQVLAAHKHTADVDGEPPAGDGLQPGVLTHPGHHALGFEKVREHHLTRRLDINGCRVLSHPACQASCLAAIRPRRPV